MSNVGKAGPAVAPPGGAGRPEGGERATKAGTFEKVLQDKSGGGRLEGPQRPVERQLSAVEQRATRGSGSTSTEAPAEREKGEPRDWRALPGDVAVPSRAPAAPAPPGVEGSRAADAVARVERIAEQIVRGVEVRLGPAGSAEVRLQLDLGGLGQVKVDLVRDAEGKVAVRFDAAGAEASRLLADHGQELAGRLEARGIALREVAMTSPDGSLVRIGSPSEPATAELAARLAEDAARSREQAASRQADERERRGRRDSKRVEDEEDE
jgi:hypothetical protein